jgi:putative DNA-invertase from lambdoid prophage Rac
MKTAAIYVPVSSYQDQDTRKLHCDALRHEWNVVEYRERRDKARVRPVYSEMLRHASENRFEVVLVQSPDCFARSLLELYKELTLLHRFGVRLVATDGSMDIDPETSDGRMFVSNLAVILKAGKDMITRNVREGIARAQDEGVHCGRPRRSFPTLQALKLQKQGFTIRAIAASIGRPVSTVGAALKARSVSLDKSGGDANSEKQSNRARGSRPRRAFPLYEASKLRERGWTIRAVAARIDFPVSTVASALKAQRLVNARTLAAKVERSARANLKPAKLKTAKPSSDRGPQPNIRFPDVPERSGMGPLERALTRG